MLLGTMWYILFNVIAGAMVIPSDLREAATSFHIQGRQRFWTVYAPGIFPYLVTGWVTAAGGAWNASILAEYVKAARRQGLDRRRPRALSSTRRARKTTTRSYQRPPS